MSDSTGLTPIEIAIRRRGRRRLLVVLLLVVSLLVYFYWLFHPDRPVDYSDIQEHFKYGSIGSEPANGIPYWILKVLPRLFPDKLPGKGYASLGFVEEEGRDLPIGFSRRRVTIDRAWLNCSVCHTGTVRDTPGSKPKIYLGMPANTMNLQALVRFLTACAKDERFTAERMMPEIERIGDLNFLEALFYRNIVIRRTRDGLLSLDRVVSFFDHQPGDWGPGRVDTFNPYKLVQFNFPVQKLPQDEIVGVSDLPSIWLQRKRVGMELHWDGNNDSVEERNKSAALGAGVTPTTIDIPRIERIEDWLWELAPPGYPYEIDTQLAARGKPLPGYPFNRTHPGLQFSRGGSLEGDPGSAGARAPRAAWATPPGAAWWR